MKVSLLFALPSKSLVLLLSLLPCIATSATSFEWPEHLASDAFIAFADAYNRHDMSAINAFATRYHAEENRTEAARYWYTLFRDFHEITPYKVDPSWSNDQRLAVWFQGVETKAWVMILFVMDDAGQKILGKSVLRGYRPTGTEPLNTALEETQLNAYLSAYMERLERSDYFSGSVLVAKGENILFEGAYGLRNRQTQAKNTENTAFLIGSTSKSITALAVAQLVSKGKLRYTDTLNHHIPEYPVSVSSQVTIADLLTHTSGIELDNHAPFYEAWRTSGSLDEVLAAHQSYIRHLNDNRYPNFSVLGKHDYSNENYDLLGIVIERASGMPFSQYLKKHVFNIAGMTNAFADYQALGKAPDVATGYTYTLHEGVYQSARVANDSMQFQTGLPSGGLYASVRDLHRFMVGITGGTLIDKHHRDSLFERHVEMDALPGYQAWYGYGFETHVLGDTISVGHNGAWIGAGSQFTYYPEQGYSVIVLTNYDSMAAQTVAHHIRDIISPK